MKGMTLNEFENVMLDYDEIEFSYRDEEYNFQKMIPKGSPSNLIIEIWRAGSSPKCIYSKKIDHFTKNDIHELLNYPIFNDGKSIISGENDIVVEFYT